MFKSVCCTQDARLCIWDVQMVPTKGELVTTPAFFFFVPASLFSMCSIYFVGVACCTQDARLCIWDVQMVPTEGELVATPALGMRKSASMQKLEMSRKSSGELLAMLNQQVSWRFYKGLYVESQLCMQQQF